MAKGESQGSGSTELCPRSCQRRGSPVPAPTDPPPGVHSLTCCSSNSVENRWVTDKISREKEKEPPPYLGEQRDG